MPNLVIYDAAFDNANFDDTGTEFLRLNNSRKVHLGKCTSSWKEYESVVQRVDKNDGTVDFSNHSVQLVADNFASMRAAHKTLKEIHERMQYLCTRLVGTTAVEKAENETRTTNLNDCEAARAHQMEKQESGLIMLEAKQIEAKHQEEIDKEMRIARIKAEAEATARQTVATNARREKRQRRDQGETISSDEDDAAAAIKKHRRRAGLCETFRPKRILEVDDTPMVLDNFKDQFTRFINLSDLERDEKYEKTILDVLFSCVSPAVRDGIISYCKEEEGGCNSVLHDDNNPEAKSAFWALDSMWKIRFPLNSLRESFFRLEQAENQSYDEFLVMVNAHADKARIQDMKGDDIRTFVILNGIRKKYPDILSKLVFAGKSTETVATKDISTLVRATQQLQAYAKPSGGGAAQATVNRIQHRSGNQQGKHSQSQQNQQQPAFMALTGNAKIAAMNKAGYCYRCARKHTGECKFKTATCELCSKVGHIRRACGSAPAAAATSSKEVKPAATGNRRGSSTSNNNDGQ